MNDSERSPALRALLERIIGKRARLVLEHIIEHGYITTEELKNYGYNHPLRAARDVREQGVPLETFRVKDADGRTIAAYRLGDLAQVRSDRLGGRSVFSKNFKRALITIAGSKGVICDDHFEARYLQIDHRIPYAISGEPLNETLAIGNYQLLYGTCNRAKSWSCEHCPNMIEKNPTICGTCYWAQPTTYEHVATRPIRCLDLVWAEGEIDQYQILETGAKTARITLSALIKNILDTHIKKS